MNSSVLAALRLLTEVWGGVNVGFTATLLVGVYVLRRDWARPSALQLPARGGPASPPGPAIAILRPCEGDEPGLAENLRSSLTAPHDGPREVLFLVPSEADPAYAVAQAVAAAAVTQAASEATSVRVLTTTPPSLCNRKVWQLEVGVQHCHADLLVCADSDVRLQAGDLQALLRPLQPPAQTADVVGAVFAAPIEVAPQTAWDRASADLVSASAQSFLALYGLQALLGRLTGRASAPQMAGALTALSRSALQQIGGFAPFRDCLGEDNEIARRLTEQGYRIAISDQPAHCYDGGRDAAAVIARVARWQTVVRAQRPALWPTYPLMLGATPTLLVLALVWPSPTLWAFVTTLFVLRTVLSQTLLRVQGLPAGIVRAMAAMLGAEALIWISFLRSARSRRIRWRGHPFFVERGGRLHPTTAD